MPTQSAWVKTTPFGDYTDPKQNHKEGNRNTEQYHLVRLCKKFGRHAGSKRMHALRSHIYNGENCAKIKTEIEKTVEQLLMGA